jgi:HD-like signal output (HDOD) protein
VEVRNFAEKSCIPLIEAETKILGINHAEICKIVSDKWSLPLDLEYSLVYHHNPGAADKLHELIATVHFADILAHELGASLWDNEPPPPQWNDYRTILKISDNDYTKIRQTLEDSMEKSLEFFSIIK